MNISIVIPTLNAGPQIGPLLDTLQAQTRRPNEIRVVDSSSDDGTAETAARHGAQVQVIPRSKYDHGGTRDMALRQTRGDFVLFLTQDALPSDHHYIEKLLQPFDDERVAAVSGRQLPAPDAQPYMRAIQAYRYPPQGRSWTAEDRAALGIRAFHLSDVCAAYRRSAYEAVGGFAQPLIINEDMLIAADLLEAGYRLVYCADACVVHSHHFTLAQEYRRNWLIGRFLEANQERFQTSEMGEGTRMFRTIATQLLREGHAPDCATFAASCCARLLGNRAGRRFERRKAAGR